MKEKQKTSGFKENYKQKKKKFFFYWEDF